MKLPLFVGQTLVNSNSKCYMIVFLPPSVSEVFLCLTSDNVITFFKNNLYARIQCSSSVPEIQQIHDSTYLQKNTKIVFLKLKTPQTSSMAFFLMSCCETEGFSSAADCVTLHKLLHHPLTTSLSLAHSYSVLTWNAFPLPVCSVTHLSKCPHSSSSSLKAF